MGFIASFLKKQSYDAQPGIYENHNSIPRGVGPRDQSLQPYCKLRDIVSLTAVVTNSWTVCCIALDRTTLIIMRPVDYYSTRVSAVVGGGGAQN